MRLSKKLFFILVLLLPLNLGKHFEIHDSYVWGILSDYLVPVLYVQDILVLGILAFWLYEKGIPSRKNVLDFLNDRINQILILLIFAVGFSVAGSDRLLSSGAIFLRLILYIFLFFYTKKEVEPEKDFGIILKLLAAGVIFLSVLAAAQFIKQGSLFNNYLFLGEQPYTTSTWGINKENVLGVTKVPAYGLFRHPNIFGGFLSVVLIWIVSRIKSSKLLIVAFILGLAGLFLTFSFVAWAGFITGLASFFYIRYYGETTYEERKGRIVVVFLAMFLLINLLVPLLVNFQQPSLFRRGSLYLFSLSTIAKNPFFGTGPGGFITGLGDMRFTQPVHNIFLLVFSECGVFSFLLFVAVFVYAIKRMINPSYFFVFLISLLQIAFMGSLDHYFWSIHQTSALMWITLGLSLSNRS
jgi:O-antigen ligase